MIRLQQQGRSIASAAATTVLTLAALAGAPAAHAVVVYSGVLNLTVPATSTGLYINFVSGSTYTGPDTFPALGGPGANYDLNLYGTTTWTLFAPGSTGQSAPVPVPAASKGWVAATTSSGALDLAVGTLIGNGSTYSTSSSAALLVTGSPAIIGVRFRNEGADLSSATDDTVHYGWARLVLTNGQPGTLIDYAFESTPLTAIAAGVVPEPGSWALMAAGLLGMAAFGRRRSR